MNAVLGAFLLMLGVIFFGWTYVQYRRPNPSRWTTMDMPSNFVTLSCIGLFAFGLGSIVRFLTHLETERFAALEMAAVLAILAGTIGIILLLRRQLRSLRTAAASGSATVTPFETPGGRPPPLSRGSGAGPSRRRKAA